LQEASQQSLPEEAALEVAFECSALCGTEERDLDYTRSALIASKWDELRRSSKESVPATVVREHRRPITLVEGIYYYVEGLERASGKRQSRSPIVLSSDDEEGPQPSQIHSQGQPSQPQPQASQGSVQQSVQGQSTVAASAAGAGAGAHSDASQPSNIPDHLLGWCTARGIRALATTTAAMEVLLDLAGSNAQSAFLTTAAKLTLLLLSTLAVVDERRRAHARGEVAARPGRKFAPEHDAARWLCGSAAIRCSCSVLPVLGRLRARWVFCVTMRRRQR
jgi:hypothetical protein